MNPDLELAQHLADVADAITMRHFRSVDLRVESKPDRTPVSIADREAEQAMREILTAQRPGDAVVGEEYGAAGDATRRWILDPIDATKNYIRGIPVFATLIALEEEGEITVGVVSAPALGARWWASRGEGAFSGDRRLSVSRIGNLDQAQLCHAGFEEWRDGGHEESLIGLSRRCARTRGFGDFWQHMLVAQGSAEIAIDPVVSLWDMAAIKVIVEEAGGRFSDLAGVSTAEGGSGVSSNGLLHDEALNYIGRSAASPPRR
ncbi:MAG: histidinol-phosphatase [Candidatus Dormibacteria bacterium]